MPKEQQGPSPVEGLRHGGRLLEIERADRAHHPGDLLGECGVDPRNASQDDVAFALDARIVHGEEQAPSLERLRELAGVVGREHHEGQHACLNRPQLRDRHLPVGEHFEQQGFCFDLKPVDLVDEQDDRLRRTDGHEQRSGKQEVLREDVLLHLVPVALARVGLDTKELLLVVPLVDGLRLVQTLIALQANQAPVARLGHGLRQLGLAHARRTLAQDGLGELVGDVDRDRALVVREVSDRGQPFPGLGRATEQRHAEILTPASSSQPRAAPTAPWHGDLLLSGARATWQAAGCTALRDSGRR